MNFMKQNNALNGELTFRYGCFVTSYVTYSLKCQRKYSKITILKKKKKKKCPKIFAAKIIDF